MFCSNREEYYNYFHNWLAFVIQKPKEKTKVAIILRSQQGVGKGFISNILKLWYGSNFFSLNGTTPDQKFNSFMHNKKVIWIDEVSVVFRDMNVMNSLITETNIAIERKGVDQTAEVNLANFIGGTNHQLKLPLTTDSRRWFLCSAPEMLDGPLIKWRTHMRGVWNDVLEPATRIRRQREFQLMISATDEVCKIDFRSLIYTLPFYRYVCLRDEGVHDVHVSKNYGHFVNPNYLFVVHKGIKLLVRRGPIQRKEVGPIPEFQNIAYEPLPNALL
jgi:hypothetical protein